MNSLLTKLADKIEEKESSKPSFMKKKSKDFPPDPEKKEEEPEKEISKEPGTESVPEAKEDPTQEVPGPVSAEVSPVSTQPVGLKVVIDFLQQYPEPSDDIYQMASQSGISEAELKSSLHALALKMVNFLRSGFMVDKGLDIASVNQNELGIGTKIEYEHTPDDAIAKKIALDHLADLPDYYTRLQAMLSEGRATIGAAAVPTIEPGSTDDTIEEEQPNQVKHNTPTKEDY